MRLRRIADLFVRRNMDIITKYKDIVQTINEEIKHFNSLLAQHRFELLDASSHKSWFEVANKPWRELNLGLCPYGHSKGLYVLCAYQKDDPASYAAYVGKASIGSETIASRVGSWLGKSPERTNGVYTMNDVSAKSFIIEAVIAMGVGEQPMPALTAALEEFVIDELQLQGIHLLNGKGVKR